MSFADSPVQQRQTTTAVYKAVLVDFGDYTNDDLKECLLPPPQSPSNSSTSSTSSSSTTTTKLRQLLSGSVLGVIAAVLGLLWLAHSRDSAAQQHNQQPQEQHYPPLTIFWFALVWSSATAITAFCVFNATMRRFSYSATSTTTTTNKQQSDEYSFALGVFAGFCATCTAHDATHGVPITSLLVTAGLALFWGLLMACSARGGGGDGVAEEEEEEEETCTPRRGTHLPMISFVV